MENEYEQYKKRLDRLEDQVQGITDFVGFMRLVEGEKARRGADPIGCEFLGRFLCYFYGASYGGYRAEEFRDFCLRHLVRNEYVQEVTNFFRKLGEPQTEKPETKPLEEKVQYCAICGDTI